MVSDFDTISGKQITVLNGDLRRRVELLGILGLSWEDKLSAMIKTDTGFNISSGDIDKLNKVYAAAAANKSVVDIAGQLLIGAPFKVDDSNYKSVYLAMQSFVKNIDAAKSAQNPIAEIPKYLIGVGIIAGLFGLGYVLNNVRGFIPTTVKVKN